MAKKISIAEILESQRIQRGLPQEESYDEERSYREKRNDSPGPEEERRLRRTASEERSRTEDSREYSAVMEEVPEEPETEMEEERDSRSRKEERLSHREEADPGQPENRPVQNQMVPEAEEEPAEEEDSDVQQMNLDMFLERTGVFKAIRPEDWEENSRGPEQYRAEEEPEAYPEEELPEEEPEEESGLSDAFEEFHLEDSRTEEEKADFMRKIPRVAVSEPVREDSEEEEWNRTFEQEEQRRMRPEPEIPVTRVSAAGRRAVREERPERAVRGAPYSDYRADRRDSRAEDRYQEELSEETFYEEDTGRDVPYQDVSYRERRNQERRSREKRGKKKQRSGLRGFLGEAAVFLIVFLICLVLVPTFVLQRTIVDGHSMEEQLQDGDQLLVEKVSGHFKEYKRFDVVVFYPFGKEKSKEYYVKRVIGLPGETIQIKGDDIYIDGEVLDEDYGKDPMTYSGIASEPITLEADEYFLLGDNREISFDSRYEQVGTVHKDQIEGKAFFRIWPLKSLGGID